VRAGSQPPRTYPKGDQAGPFRALRGTGQVCIPLAKPPEKYNAWTNIPVSCVLGEFAGAVPQLRTLCGIVSLRGLKLQEQTQVEPVSRVAHSPMPNSLCWSYTHLARSAAGWWGDMHPLQGLDHVLSALVFAFTETGEKNT